MQTLNNGMLASLIRIYNMYNMKTFSRYRILCTKCINARFFYIVTTQTLANSTGIGDPLPYPHVGRGWRDTGKSLRRGEGGGGRGGGNRGIET